MLATRAVKLLAVAQAAWGMQQRAWLLGRTCLSLAAYQAWQCLAAELSTIRFRADTEAESVLL